MNYGDLVQGRKKWIIDSTPADETQAGKLDVIDEISLFLASLCPKEFQGTEREEIEGELEAKVRDCLKEILARNGSCPEKYRNGMNPALNMIGGYYFVAVAKTA